MDKILHYFKYPKLWELWYIPYYGSCRILSISPSLAIELEPGSEGPKRGYAESANVARNDPGSEIGGRGGNHARSKVESLFFMFFFFWGGGGEIGML